jgi:hypothetical protein
MFFELHILTVGLIFFDEREYVCWNLGQTMMVQKKYRKLQSINMTGCFALLSEAHLPPAIVQARAVCTPRQRFITAAGTSGNVRYMKKMSAPELNYVKPQTVSRDGIWHVFLRSITVNP